MEIIYKAFDFFKTNGFVHLPHIISMSQDIDMQDLYYFYKQEKDNKEIIHFMDHYQNEYGLKTTKKGGNTYKIGILSNGECIICYDENKTGLKTPCNHFMCIECCVKLFKHDKTIKKCPYCREDVVLYGMNEIINIVKKNEENQCQSDIINFMNMGSSSRLLEDIYFIPTIPELVENYSNSISETTPYQRLYDSEHANIVTPIVNFDPIEGVSGSESNRSTTPIIIRHMIRRSLIGKRSNYIASNFLNISNTNEVNTNFRTAYRQESVPLNNINLRMILNNDGINYQVPNFNRRQRQIQNNNTKRNVQRRGFR